MFERASVSYAEPRGGIMRRIPGRSIAIAVALGLASTWIGVAPARAGVSTWISTKYPLQTHASETTAPSTHKWALLIGLNDYASPTVDNIGARQDAEGMRTILVGLG